jgi:hypothetical protein
MKFQIRWQLGARPENSKGANRSNYALGLTEWIVRTRLLVRYGQNMSKYKVGDHVQVKLSGGRIVPGDHQGRRRNDRGCELAGVIWRGDSADLPWQIVIEAH